VNPEKYIAMLRRLRTLFFCGKRGKSGSVAVEFGLVAPTFFMILFGTFETGMSYFGNLVLTNGVHEVSRLVRTGQVQNSGMTQSAFRQALCNEVSFLLSCDATKLLIDVRSFSSFGSSSFPSPLDQDGAVKSGFDSFSTGSSSAAGGASIVLVRAMYTWPLYTPGLSSYFSNMQAKQRLLSASVAFRNEPF